MSLRDTSESASAHIRRVSPGLQSGAVLGRHQSIAESLPQLTSMRPSPLEQTDSSSDKVLRNTNDGLATVIQRATNEEIFVVATVALVVAARTTG
jgi:hypothetical protein